MQTSLSVTATSAFGTLYDQLGNPYQQLVNVTGTRLYTYLPTNATLLSTVTGLSGQFYSPRNRFYPYALLSAAPGIYTVNTAPFLDALGLVLDVSPNVPLVGAAPGSGATFSRVEVSMANFQTESVLMEVNLLPDFVAETVPTPSLAYQQQTFTLLGN